MKTKRRYIKTIVVVIILSIVFFLTIGLNLIKNQKQVDLIVLDNNVILKKENRKWISIKEVDDLKKYNWNMLYTFVDNQYLGKYNIYFNEELYLFDKDKNAVNYNGNLIAFSNSKYKLVDFTTNNITNDYYIDKVLNENDLNNNSLLTSEYYIELDIDNDSVNEQLFVISNKFPIDDIVDNKYFSFVFLVDNEKTIMLYKNIEKTEDSYSGCKPYIKSILDIDNDNQYEIILNCAQYSTGKIDSMMYKYKRNQFELVTSS